MVTDRERWKAIGEVVAQQWDNSLKKKLDLSEVVLFKSPYLRNYLSKFY